MNAIIGWIIVFAIICGCIFAWTYMCHRGPHADENELSDCNGDCLHCAKNVSNHMMNPDDCEEHTEYK